MAGPQKLIVLGSGTSVPKAGRTTSCYLVDPGDGQALAIDLGPGALQRAAAAGYDLDHLRGVLLTHMHPDHTADLVALDFALRNPIPRPDGPPLPILGHPDARLLLARVRNAWPRWLGSGPDRLVVHDIGPGPLDDVLPGPVRARAHPIVHTWTSLGYRLVLPDGFVIAFSGDATECDELLELGRDADLFVLESAATDDEGSTSHLSPRQAGRIAASCGARHLLLTHFYPPVLREPIEERVREAFEGRLDLAQDGMVVPLVR